MPLLHLQRICIKRAVSLFSAGIGRIQVKKLKPFTALSSGNNPYTTFNLQNAYTDSSCETFNTNSAEYKVPNDIDIAASLQETF